MQLSSKFLILHRCSMTSYQIQIADFTGLPFDLCKTVLRQLHLLFVLWQESLRGILTETALDHLFNLKCFHAQQVQDHVVRETELRSQLGGLSENHLLQCPSGRCLILSTVRDDNITHCVKTSATCTTGHLGIFTRKEVTETL